MKMESKKVNYLANKSCHFRILGSNFSSIFIILQYQIMQKHPAWVLVYHSYPLPIGWMPSNGFGGQAQYFNKVKKDSKFY